MELKKPPYSEEAEQAVLGAIILAGQTVLLEVAEILKSIDFYFPQHQELFTLMLTLAEQNKPIDIVTLGERLNHNPENFAYIATLARNTPSSANAKGYAGIVKEKAIRRSLMNKACEIYDISYDENLDVKQIIEDVQHKIMSVTEHSSKREPRKISDILGETVDYISERLEANSSITGLASGFNELDELTGGLQKGEFTIIAARPGMGKTTFALNIAENLPCTQDKPVVIFSMEMPAKQLSLRMIASQGKIEQNKLKSGKLSEIDFTKITAGIERITNKNIIIDDSGDLSSLELKSKVRKIVMQYGGIGAVFIDYLQIMRLPGQAENRAVGIAEVSRALKALAMELNIPVIAIAQLNRNLEQRGDKRPILSDLKESGSLEQDADLIIFIYRDEVYNKESLASKKAEIIIGKQRNGAIGSFNLSFTPEFSKFENLTCQSS